MCPLGIGVAKNMNCQWISKEKMPMLHSSLFSVSSSLFMISLWSVLLFREVETETITNFICGLEFPFQINKNIICISGAEGKSTCNVRFF